MGTFTRAIKPTTTTFELNDRVQRFQASMVKHHYVRSEIHHINSRKGEALIEDTLAALKKTAHGQHATREQLIDLLVRMTQRLQTADLTINFNAKNWFTKPNDSTSYQQVYERNVSWTNMTNEMRLATMEDNRLASDEVVTFRQGMKDANGNFNPAFGGIGRIMSPGKVTAAPQAYTWLPSNQSFNPRAKQVFAALNYGRRSRGSTPMYGSSYLVLNPKFKRNAIYFAADTFLQANGAKVMADDQVSYDLLGAIYAKGSIRFQKDVYESCILNSALPNISIGYSDMEMLLEAHLFEGVTFAGNIVSVNVCRAECGTNDEWSTIWANARKFASKNGAKVRDIA